MGLFFSAAKTKAMVFERNQKKRDTLKSGEDPIEYTKEFTYLGIKLDSTLTFNKHAEHLKKKINTRLNMIKIISTTRQGVSTSTLIMIYKALVQPLLRFSAPAIIIASKPTKEKLEIAQRTALKIVLGLARNSHNTLTSAETGIPSVAALAEETTAKYLLRSAIQKRPTVTSSDVQNHLNRHPDLFKTKSWTSAAARIQATFEIPRLHPVQYQTIPPWEDIPIRTLQINTTKKADDPTKAAEEARVRIQNLSTDSHLHIYTDGSLQENGTAGGGLFIDDPSTEDNTMIERIDDSSPIALTELQAIKAAITVAFTRPEDNINIHTDSMAALQILSSRDIRRYPETKHQIWEAARLASTRGKQITLHWIPSHVDIRGNEEANHLGNSATKPGCYTHLFTRHQQKVRKDNTSRANGRHHSWYQATTEAGHTITPFSRHIDTQLRALRTWAFMKNHAAHSNNKCPHCTQDLDPIHYLVPMGTYTQEEDERRPPLATTPSNRLPTGNFPPP